MKKKIILMISTLVCMLTLCSCGSNKDEFNGLSATQVQSACEQMAANLEEIGQDEVATYIEYYSSQEDGEIYADLLTDWAEVEPQIGEFVGYKSFEMTKAGKTISAVEEISYTERDIKLTYVINANSLEVTAINVEIVYTMGETMAKAGLNTIMAICIVFAVLILISLVIYGFNLIPKIQAKFAKSEKDEKEETKVAPVKEEVVSTDDTELVAVIAAAIAASTGSSTDSFVVRSIKRRY